MKWTPLLRFGDFYSARLAGDNRFETYQVIKEFGRFLAKDGEPVALFRLTVEDLQKALKGFFAGSRAEPGEEDVPKVTESS